MFQCLLHTTVELSELKGDGELKDDVASHVQDTLSPSDRINVGIFESAQVTLISLIGEVGPHDAQAGYTLSLDHDVGADGGIEQAVGRRGGFGVIGTVVMVLLEVIVHSQRDEGIVQQASVMQDFPLDI